MDIKSLRGRRVTVVEVGPRDGLQNEQARISTADKVEFVDRLSAAHLPVIEVSAFVSAKWVPQMADAAEVFAGIARAPGIRYTDPRKWPGRSVARVQEADERDPICTAASPRRRPARW